MHFRRSAPAQPDPRGPVRERDYFGAALGWLTCQIIAFRFQLENERNERHRLMAIEIKGLTTARLHELLSYDPETGEFRSKVWRGRVRIGALVGGLTCKGYWQIGIDFKSYEAHRLAWFYMYGEFPPSDIDHINRNRADNRIANLRLATPSQNLANSTYPPNKCGFRGVGREKSGRWKASIMVQYRSIRLGTFDSPEAASAAYQAARIKYFAEFAV